MSHLVPPAAALGAVPERENRLSSFRTFTATVASTPSVNPPKKAANMKYATDAALPLKTASHTTLPAARAPPGPTCAWPRTDSADLDESRRWPS